jgi:hypothetical protein
MKAERAPEGPLTSAAAKQSGAASVPQDTDDIVFPRRRTVRDDAAVAELARFLGECRSRRQDAAKRLPPMADGRRDPFGPVTDGAQP